MMSLDEMRDCDGVSHEDLVARVGSLCDEVKALRSQLGRVLRDHDQALDNLTVTQVRCTELKNEVGRLEGDLERVAHQLTGT